MPRRMERVVRAKNQKQISQVKIAVRRPRIEITAPTVVGGDGESGRVVGCWDYVWGLGS